MAARFDGRGGAKRFVAETGEERRYDMHRALVGGDLDLPDRPRKLIVGSLQLTFTRISDALI